MCKKIFISFLIVAVFNLLVGCYSSELITVPEYKQIEEKDGKPVEIYVKTNGFQEYHFSDFYIENDTLYGKGKLLLSDGEQLLNRKIALSDIESIELESVSAGKTVAFVLGIVGIGVLLFLGIWAIKLSGLK